MDAIIFDWNRTLYSPDSGRLFPGARSLLKMLSSQKALLILISRKEKGRSVMVREKGLCNYFTELKFVESKSPTLFRHILKKHALNPHRTFVIGDRVREEIRSGNLAGMQTIWVRQGKFKSERPRNNTEKPDHAASSIKELIVLLDKNNYFAP